MANLTIVTPTLNCANTLRWTLESIRAVRDQGADHVVVDSCSQDGTLEICKEFGARVIQVEKGNMYEAINQGLTGARHEWCTYINGDDLLYPEAVEAALERFGQSADVIYGCADYIDIQGRFLCSWVSSPPRDLLGVFAYGVLPIAQQGTLFRKRVFEKLGGFQTRYRYSSDFDFFLRALLAGSSFSQLACPPMASFRLHAQQISQAKRKEMLAECRSSLSQNGVSIGTFRPRLAFWKFRARNWHNYVIRFLRTKALLNSFQARSSLFLR